jgi:hypothetical protein
VVLVDCVLRRDAAPSAACSSLAVRAVIVLIAVEDAHKVW